MLTIAATTLLVVDSLNAATTGDIVFRGGHLHVRIVGQVDGNLHKAFPVRAQTYYYTSIHILNGTAGDFAGRGCLTIHEHYQWHHRIEWFHTGLVLLRGLFDFSSVLNNSNTLRQPEVQDIHSLLLRSAAIATQI